MKFENVFHFCFSFYNKIPRINFRLYGKFFFLLSSFSSDHPGCSVHLCCLVHHLTLHTTMCPSPLRFCYQCSYESDNVIQLHTHDYIELFYVVEGEFQQIILGKTLTFHEGDFCLIFSSNTGSLYRCTWLLLSDSY